MATNGESNAYQRGYAAGRKHPHALTDREFWEQAMLAALPECVSTTGWTTGKSKTPLTSRTARAGLAAAFADDALTERQKRWP